MQHAGEGAGFLLGCWRAGADERRPSDGRRTVELRRRRDHQYHIFALFNLFTGFTLRLLTRILNIF